MDLRLRSSGGKNLGRKKQFLFPFFSPLHWFMYQWVQLVLHPISQGSIRFFITVMNKQSLPTNRHRDSTGNIKTLNISGVWKMWYSFQETQIIPFCENSSWQQSINLKPDIHQFRFVVDPMGGENVSNLFKVSLVYIF